MAQVLASDGLLSDQPAPGADCSTVAWAGSGGAGGTGTVDPEAGENIAPSMTETRWAGGGGGAAGYIRIITLTGSYTADSSVVISPEEATATLNVQ